MNSSDDDE